MQSDYFKTVSDEDLRKAGLLPEQKRVRFTRQANTLGRLGLCGTKEAQALIRAATKVRAIDLGNNESLTRGIFDNGDGTYTALTFSQSKTFKTRKGAERWLARKSAR